jgi:hypothetical protein
MKPTCVFSQIAASHFAYLDMVSIPSELANLNNNNNYKHH